MASTPFALASDRSLSEGPLGRFSPRSHWLINEVVTLSASAKIAWLIRARSRIRLMSSGAKGSTGVRHAVSNRRIVALSTAPTFSSPFIARWTLRSASLRYFRSVFAMFNLDPFLGFDEGLDIRVVELRDVLGCLAIDVLLSSRQVPLRVLREEVQHQRQLASNVDDDGAVPAATPLARPRDALLDQEFSDDATDQPAFGTLDRFCEILVRNPLLTSGPRELLGLEQPHWKSPEPAAAG